MTLVPALAKAAAHIDHAAGARRLTSSHAHRTMWRPTGSAERYPSGSHSASSVGRTCSWGCTCSNLSRRRPGPGKTRDPASRARTTWPRLRCSKSTLRLVTTRGTSAFAWFPTPTCFSPSARAARWRHRRNRDVHRKRNSPEVGRGTRSGHHRFRNRFEDDVLGGVRLRSTVRQ